MYILEAHVCLFKQNVIGKIAIRIRQFGIVHVEHIVAAAVEEVKKTLNDDCRMPLNHNPLHEDERNVNVVVWSKNCPAVRSVKTLTSLPSTSTFIRADLDRISGRRSFRRTVHIGERVCRVSS